MFKKFISEIFLDKEKIRRINRQSLEVFKTRYPEINYCGQVSDFVGYVQYKHGYEQICLLLDRNFCDEWLDSVISNKKYTEVDFELFKDNDPNRRIRNLFKNFWNYKDFLQLDKYKCVLNCFLSEIWLKKEIPNLFDDESFDFETSKNKNLFKMDFMNHLEFIEYYYGSFEDFYDEDVEMIYLEVSSILFSCGYYQSVIKDLNFSKVTDNHRKIIKNRNDDKEYGHIWEFWTRVINTEFKKDSIFFYDDTKPNLEKLLS
jgi:hypothetical protein